MTPDYSDMPDEYRMRCVSVIHTVAANIHNMNLSNADFREFVYNSIKTIPSAEATCDKHSTKSNELPLAEFKRLEKLFEQRYLDLRKEDPDHEPGELISLELPPASTEVQASAQRIQELARLICVLLEKREQELEARRKYSETVQRLAAELL